MEFEINLVKPPNSAELVYCILGSATVSHKSIQQQQNEYFHHSWSSCKYPTRMVHREIARSDNIHAPYPQYMFGSDILTKAPIEVLACKYCLDPEQLLNKFENMFFMESPPM